MLINETMRDLLVGFIFLNNMYLITFSTGYSNKYVEAESCHKCVLKYVPSNYNSLLPTENTILTYKEQLYPPSL